MIKKDYILIGESLSLRDQPDRSYNIYPNPVGNILHLEFDNIGHNTLKILNSQGKFLYSAKVMEQLNVSFLKSGSYFLIIDDEVVIPFIKE